MLSKRDRIVWLVLCASLVGALAIVGPLQWTGDEPRYTYQALGVAGDHRLYPSIERWDAFLQANHEQSGYLGVLSRPYQTLATAVAYGPALLLFGLEAARWMCFAIGCAGLWFLLAALRSASRDRFWPPVAACAIVAYSPAFLAHLRLLYPETLLFLGVCVALYALCTQRIYVGSVASALLPFIHVRALPLSIAFFVVFAIDARAAALPRTSRRNAALVYTIVLLAFVAYQFILSGSLAGYAFSEYQPAANIFAQRLAMQLFGVRHGLLIYAPLAIAGIAGLLIGAIRRQPLQTYALVLIIAYAGTFMWSEAGESWSGRFWVAGLPFVAIGIDYLMRNMREFVAWVSFAALASLNAYTAVLFIAHPYFYLQNRQAAIPYFILSTIIPVHLELLLPVDAYPSGIPAYTGPVLAVLVWLAAILASLTVAVTGNLRARRVAALSSLACVAIPIAASVALPLRDAAYTITPSAQTLAFHMSEPENVWAIAFLDKTGLAWTEGTYPRTFRITCRRAATTISESIVPSRPMLALRGCGGADSIEIHGDPAGEGAAFMRDPGRTEILVRPLR